MKERFLLILLIPFLTCCMHRSRQADKSSGRYSPSMEIDSKDSLKKFEITQEVIKPNCYIDSIMGIDNKYYIKVEYIDFLGGDEAVAAAKKDGYAVIYTVISGDTIWYVPDDYYIISKDTIKSTFVVSEKVEISLIKELSSESESGKTIHDLQNVIDKNNNNTRRPYIIKVKNGVITSITEFYLP